MGNEGRRSFQLPSLFHAVLLFPAVEAVQDYRAADQRVPVGSVFDDQVQIRNRHEEVLDADRA
jgi:hypothetical protein